MCGICGFVTNQKVSLDELRRMNDTMYHRGPDDNGAELFDMKNGITLGLAQRRLSILDLSPSGHQPMHSRDGRVSVVFNGEIYNYQELKEELADYPYVSTCDTEVILASYLRWGLKFPERLKGMFAIALYDRDTNEVYLVRDRIGKKPLYYWLTEGHFVFASELKPIMEYPYYNKEINQEVLGRYLYQQYLTGPDSIFKDVYKVAPGGIVKYKNSVVSQWKYWDVGLSYHAKKGTGPKDYDEAKKELKNILEKSVCQRMIADVPLGTFLSGGYDSSLVSAIAQSVSDKPIKTFSVGFHDERYNEAIYAKSVAKHLGTEHTEMYIDDGDMLQLVDSIPMYFDEPFADSSQIATMLVSKLARQQVTVALSGDGGDEFFCGYNIYTKVLQAQKLDKLGTIAHQIGKLGNLEECYPFKIKVISKNCDKKAKTQFIGGNTLKIVHSMVREPGICCYYDKENEYKERDWQKRRMLLDMDTYLPGDILCKVDRASMKYSLETRCPILDVDVMEFAFSIPHEFKYKDGVKKRILKDLTYEYIPRELMERPKVGFAVPMDKWLHGPLKEQLLSMSTPEYLKNQGLFNEGYITAFLTNYLEKGDAGPGSGANYSRIVWAFFVFQQWYQTYMK